MQSAACPRDDILVNGNECSALEILLLIWNHSCKLLNRSCLLSLHTASILPVISKTASTRVLATKPYDTMAPSATSPSPAPTGKKEHSIPVSSSSLISALISTHTSSSLTSLCSSTHQPKRIHLPPYSTHSRPPVSSTSRTIPSQQLLSLQSSSIPRPSSPVPKVKKAP